jgi:hypothetical protein
MPGMGLADGAALERIFQRWELGSAPEQGPAYPNPTLILAGRRDATVGYAGIWRLLDHYPRAMFAVLDRAGHALLRVPRDQLGPAGWRGRWSSHRTRRAWPVFVPGSLPTGEGYIGGMNVRWGRHR